MWGRGDEDGTDSHIRPNWDEYGLALAQAAATRADCTRRKVGAILMASDHSIVGSGYNGGPSKGPSCLKGECPRGRLTHDQLPADSPYDSGGGKCVALHAEWNLLLRSSWADMSGATLYITEEPCHICRVLIGGTQIVKVVWPNGSWDPKAVAVVICNDWADGHSYRRCTKPKGHTDPHG
ncbi:deoxycytidylate deaminase [Gordonia phage Untouchable]|uniref:Deoxycytidylate deaminase n=1 Tax=Gordonia phage Untouchable TaxID=2656542 RepID=A0A649V9V1_9CAUD|nr:dCMP deaminase [Gordonia phage Untouchable]QGJ89110.1 deoxycytidylate deaminase [Gordonia phage Untouchable]